MSAMTVISRRETHDRLPAAGQRAGADSGDPQLGLRQIAPTANGNIGIWECQPGGWPVVDRADTEVAYILAGSARITDSATGDTHTVTAGDLIVLLPGWTGRWDVTETVRKVYAIY
jgi:uncharacterized cupin superfamily protein